MKLYLLVKVSQIVFDLILKTKSLICRASEIRDPGRTTRRWLGTYDSAAKAACAYDAAAVALHGAKARTNFIYSFQNRTPEAGKSRHGSATTGDTPTHPQGSSPPANVASTRTLRTRVTPAVCPPQSTQTVECNDNSSSPSTGADPALSKTVWVNARRSSNTSSLTLAPDDVHMVNLSPLCPTQRPGSVGYLGESLMPWASISDEGESICPAVEHVPVVTALPIKKRRGRPPKRAPVEVVEVAPPAQNKRRTPSWAGPFCNNDQTALSQLQRASLELQVLGATHTASVSPRLAPTRAEWHREIAASDTTKSPRSSDVSWRKQEGRDMDMDMMRTHQPSSMLRWQQDDKATEYSQAPRTGHNMWWQPEGRSSGWHPEDQALGTSQGLQQTNTAGYRTDGRAVGAASMSQLPNNSGGWGLEGNGSGASHTQQQNKSGWRQDGQRVSTAAETHQNARTARRRREVLHSVVAAYMLGEDTARRLGYVMTSTPTGLWPENREGDAVMDLLNAQVRYRWKCVPASTSVFVSADVLVRSPRKLFICIV